MLMDVEPCLLTCRRSVHGTRPFGPPSADSDWRIVSPPVELFNLGLQSNTTTLLVLSRLGLNEPASGRTKLYPAPGANKYFR